LAALVANRTPASRASFRGGSRLVLLVAALLAFALAIASCGDQTVERVAARVGPATFDAELALSGKQHVKGLGGRDALAPEAAMLFVFPQDGDESFVMRGMRFPLDFIWIDANKRVVAVTENVPPPEAGTEDEPSPVFRAGQLIAYVLEVNAGRVQELGISAGDAVTFEPEVDRTRAD